MVCVPFFLYAQTTTTFSFAGNQTFVAPAGVTSITVQAWGAGGAGGGTTDPGFNATRGGAGGGGGAFASATFNITPGQTMQVVVGKGGAGSVGNGANGGFSRITEYAAQISAAGGTGGARNNAGGTPVRGFGGTVAASVGTAPSPIAGADGTNGATGLGISSGAGGNAANGGGAGGAGNDDIFVSIDGIAGIAPGGGGGGSRSVAFGGNQIGGAGGDGKVIISYDCPNPPYSLTSTTASAVNVCSGSSSEITLTGNLPIGLYTVSYEIQGVLQTPASMNVTTAGTGSFIASGFTAVGTKFVKITGLSSGSSATASENCNSAITTFNTASVIVNSSGTAPVATAVTGATCTQITANWQAVSGAVYYEFDLSTDSAFGSFVTGYSALNVGNVVSFTITGLTNTTYYYRVRAFNGTCSSANSNTITHANPTTPLAPTTNTNGVATCSQITVNWTAVTGATTYFIDVSTITGANFNTGILPAYSNLNVGNVVTKDITGLNASTTYYYRVRAFNNCGTGPNSTVRTITILSITAGIPVSPNSSAATNPTCSQFTANWSSSIRASSYSIEVSRSSTAFDANRLPAYTNLNVGNVTSFDVVGLLSDTPYHYRIKAINNCGTTNASGIISTRTTTGGAGTPPIPVATAGSGQNCSQITANWNASALATTYFIDVSTSGTDFNSYILPAYNNLNVGNVLTKNITGLAVNTNYYYRIRAMNNCGTSASSNVITYNTIPTPGTPTITATPAGLLPLSICQTDGVKLTSSAASGNVWSTGETTQDIFVTSAGTFTVKVENGGGCSSNTSIPFTVNIDGLPTAVAGSLQTICSNQSTTVLGASASNGAINWTVSGGGTLNNYSIINPIYTPSLGGPGRTIILTLTVTSNNSCTPQIATAKHRINIQAAPTVLVSGSQEICSSGSATVGAGEATAADGTLLWTHDGTGSLTNATTLTPTYTAAPGDAGKQVDLTLTVTASPTCSTPYRVRGVYPVFVLANNTFTAASSSPILCINTLMNTITHTTTIASGIGTPVNLPAGVSASWASNTITISGTPTEAGTFAYSIPLTGGCGPGINAIGTIVVNLNEAGAASATPIVCNLTAMTAITHTTTGATGIDTPTNLPPGVMAVWAADVITISGTPTSTGTFNYNIPLTGGCGTANATGTITVNPLAVTPMLGTIIQPTCVNSTGSVELTGLLSGSALQIIQDGPAPRTIPVAISGSTYEIANLAPGTYTFAIQEGVNCPSLPSVTVEIKAPITNVWNTTTGWSTGTDPIFSDSIEFADNYTSTGNLSACSCKVNAGKAVIIKKGHTLTIENGVVVESGANGTLTFENNASLVQINNVLNTGNIIYNRNSVPIRQADYVYWSSPVSGQTLAGVSPLTKADKYHSYDGTKWLNVSKNTVMTVGKGYIIRGPENFSNTVRGAFSASFIGIPNNGDINGEAVILNRFYLIGNPYPSALDADEFILENEVLEGTLYFWTHNTPVVLGGAYEYASDDYASYNLTGGVRTAIVAESGDDHVDNNKSIPTGKIGAGQSFFAEVTSSGTIVFNNLMRKGGIDNTQFFKPAKASQTTVLQKNRLWLNMTNNGGAFKQTMIGYVEGATNEIDKRFDGTSFDGNQYLDFYSVNNGSNLVIQGRALPFADTDFVPLGYRAKISGEFTISIEQADGNLAHQAVYLEDKKTGGIYDLRSGNYKFTTEAGIFADRFVLRYTNKTLGTVDVKQVEQAVLVSVKDKVIKVTSTNESISGISIFDVTGKLLYTKNKIGAAELTISNLQSGNQVLLVKTILESNHTNTTKIIF